MNQKGKKMSIRGDVPIPCYNNWYCRRAGDGKTQCNPETGHCSNPLDPYSLKYDPLGSCARKFRYPAQGTLGSRADLGGPTQHENPISIDPLTWMQTVKAIWGETLNWGSVTVPGETDPTLWQKFNYIYLGTQKRAFITSAFIVLIAFLIALF